MKTVPQQVITYDNMSRYCYTNSHLVSKPRGVLLSFHGRGDPGFLSDTPFAEELAAKGIVMVFPYYDPWAWFCESARNLTDALLDALYARFGLEDDTPRFCEGGSMGGLTALLYPVTGRRKPLAAAANCPACDAVYHYSAREDLPRYFVCAYGGGEETDLGKALAAHSPLHHIDEMPSIPFYLVHGLADPMIAPGPNSERFCALVNQKGGTAYYVPVEGMGHCNMPPNVQKNYYDFILSFFREI
ncbi:MAG: prolyl oligopeptidase family serine peptidase [Abditibacteriota bacterium]|nr:prolyl oligopeptidase family serine peptidase [Abditibacteriota bacterium]